MTKYQILKVDGYREYRDLGFVSAKSKKKAVEKKGLDLDASQEYLVIPRNNIHSVTGKTHSKFYKPTFKEV